MNAVQDGYAVTPLSRWGQQPQAVRVAVDPAVDMTTPPVEQVNRMPAAAFFARAAELMKLHPPHVTDWSILARMQRIGIVPGESLDFETLDPLIKQALEQGATAAREAMQAKVPRLAPLVNGWQVPAETMGVYGNYYLKRATLAMVGLGSNPPEDAIYPLAFVDGDGSPLNGEHDYVLHFDRQDLPPVNAFWSVTVYDRDGFRSPTRSTEPPSATATPCTTTLTARWISSSGTRAPDPSKRRTGCPRRAADGPVPAPLRTEPGGAGRALEASCRAAGDVTQRLYGLGGDRCAAPARTAACGRPQPAAASEASRP